MTGNTNETPRLVVVGNEVADRISVRLKNCLKNEGLIDLEGNIDVAAIRSTDDGTFLRWANFGKVSLKEVREVFGPYQEPPELEKAKEELRKFQKRFDAREEKLENSFATLLRASAMFTEVASRLKA
jgi:DNA-directed RNA polymerase alpha subunit